MKRKFSQHIRKGLPGGANELNKFTRGVISTEGYRSNSPDKDNSVNVINSSSITMTESDGEPLKKGPLFGMDNLGNKQLMMPGFDYQFPGSQVAEIPLDYLKEQLNPVRPASIPRPHPWGFLVDPKQAQGNIVGGAGINFPRGLGFNATGVLPVSPDPVFKGVGSIGVNQQFGNLNLGARIGTPILRDYYTKELTLDPELSLSGRYTIPYTDKKKLSGPLLKEGGYMDAELSDEEIQELRNSGYVVEELPKAQPGMQTDEELLRHQIGKIMDYEYDRGSQYGTGLSNYGNPKLKPGATREDAINWTMENIGPDLIYYQTPVEKGEAADFIYNTGKDPRAYAIQEYYRKYGKDQLKDNKWPGRKGSDFTDIYKSTIGKLPENERRILMNKGRDWYYQNIERGKGSINEDLKAYKNTWYGRIHNTNDLKDYIPDNPKFKYSYKEGGELPKAQPGMQTNPVLPPEYLRSKKFETAVNQDLNSLLHGFNADGFDAHRDAMFGEDVVYGDNWKYIKEKNQAKLNNMQQWVNSGNNPMKDFENPAAYAKAMNKLANDAGGKNVTNIPFADNPMVMRTKDDDIKYEDYYEPRTIVQEGKFNPKTLNANQLQVAPEMDGLVGGMKEGGYMDIEASEEEIEMYKRGGYIIEELPNKEGECIGCLDKKQKGDAGMPECPDGAKYDFKLKSCVCSGKTRWDGTQCVQDIRETTVYQKQESRLKQLKLMDKLKLLKQAYKQFHNKGGFGNIILDVDDKTDKIPKLQKLVDLYKKELRDVERQHAPGFLALKKLKQAYPDKYKNFTLADVYAPQTFEELRGLFKEGKLGKNSAHNEHYWRYFGETLGRDFDQNVAKGTGPNATYSAKEAKDNWMHDAEGFTQGLGTAVNTLMLGTATLPLGGSGAAFGRLTAPVVRGASTLLKNPYVRGALTGYGLLQVPRYAKGAYDAYNKDDWQGVAENVGGAAISLVPGAVFKNTGKVIKGTGRSWCSN